MTVERNSREWKLVWAALAAHFNPDLERSGRLAYQAGALEQICRSSADEIALIIRQLETP